MVLPKIPASCSFTPSTNLSFMLHMTSIPLLKVKREQHFGLVLQTIVVIIHRSAIRPRTLKSPNKRLVDDGGEEDYQPHTNAPEHPTSCPDDAPTVFIKSQHDDGPTSSKPLPEFNPDDLVGRTFLQPLETMKRD